MKSHLHKQIHISEKEYKVLYEVENRDYDLHCLKVKQTSPV